MRIGIRPAFTRVFRIFPVVLLLHVSVGEGAARANTTDQEPFRVFLRDGTAVVASGEWARVGDRVVFSIPVGGNSDAAALQVVNLPASAVDWAKTEQYASGVRARQYASTRGEADYAELNATVARTLSIIREKDSPFERLQLVEQVRGIVATWGRDHFAYRAADVRQIGGLLDEMISELRAGAGVTQFDLNLVASVDPPPPVVLPRPTPAESIAQVLRLADASDVAADRVSLLQTALRMLDRDAPDLPAPWTKRTRETTAAVVAEESRIDRRYRDLAASVLARARAAASRGDTAAVEDVAGDIRARDGRLGRRRPDMIAGLLLAVDNQLDAARRMRLARDRWQMQYPLLRDYQRQVRHPMRQLAAASALLDAIKRLSGPDPVALVSTRQRLSRAVLAVQHITPPDGVAAAHATLAAACQMALQAADLRMHAIQSGDLQVAWDASSAAAGATMLIAQARDQLQAALRAPGPR